MHVCGHICLVSAAKAICKAPTHRCLKNCLPWYPDARLSFRPHPHLPVIIWGSKAELGRAGSGDPTWGWGPGWSWHPPLGLRVPISETRWLKWVTSEAFLPLRCMISSLSGVKWIYYLYSSTHSWQSASIFWNFSESITLVCISDDTDLVYLDELSESEHNPATDTQIKKQSVTSLLEAHSVLPFRHSPSSRVNHYPDFF